MLAHRKLEKLEVTGTVFIEEEPVGIGIREMSSYVEEEDIFVGSLTVCEHLIFQVKMMLSKQTKKSFTETIKHVFKNYILKNFSIYAKIEFM